MILDHQLGEGTGRDVEATLRDVGCVVPFVSMTGHGGERLAVQTRQAGVRDYLVKDIHLLELLLEVVRRVCRQLETERAVVEAREREQRLRRFLESATDGFLVLDAALQVLDCNPVAGGCWAAPGKWLWAAPCRP